MVQLWRRMGLGARLTSIMVALFLVVIASLTSLVFSQFKATQTQSVVTALQRSAELNAQAFTEWLLVRQDEMRLLATLPSVQQLDLDLATELILQLAQNSGFYDTIFVVGTDGIGKVGVSYANGMAKTLSSTETSNFNVADRAWFQQAVAGQNVFSQPLVSRATGQTVSTVAIPIRQNNQVVAVMRGAVQLETIFKKVNELTHNAYTEIYLLDTEGVAITAAPSIQGNKRLDTVAAAAARQKQSGTGLYTNAAQTAVIGSYQFIPMLGWSLVLESRQYEAFAEVRAMLWTLFVAALISLLVASGVCMLIVRGVTRTLGGEPEYAAEVVHRVAEGDLSTTINIPLNDTTSFSQPGFFAALVMPPRNQALVLIQAPSVDTQPCLAYQ
ncbi:cache domain-containing protein [Alishewanella longhuensis]